MNLASRTEVWNGICRRGIAAKIKAATAEHAEADLTTSDMEALGHVIYSIQQDSPAIYDAMMEWASGAIGDATASAGRSTT